MGRWPGNADLRSARGLWSSGLAAQEVPATRTSEPIQVDGVLDEADWNGAAAIETFTQLQPVAGTPESQRTVIRGCLMHLNWAG